MNENRIHTVEAEVAMPQRAAGTALLGRVPRRVPGEHEIVKTYMTKHVITVQEDQPVGCALELLLEYAIGCVPVLAGDKVIGVVTEHALLRAAALGIAPDVPVREVSLPAQTIDEREPLLRAIERLRHLHAGHLLVLSPEGKLEGLVSQTDLLEASRRCLILANTKSAVAETDGAEDVLTGLLTRQAFDKIFKEEFHRARKYGGLLALFFLELNDFKAINDRHGHIAGDMVLSRIGRIIKHCVRTVDYAARYSGDDFVILLPGAGTRAATILGTHILDRLSERVFTFEQNKFSITGSIGGCKWTRSCRVPNDMINIADRCLMESRRGGEGCIQIAY